MTPSGGEKPYTLYRGGRVKGKVPTVGRPSRPERADGRNGGKFRLPSPRGPKPKRTRPGARSWRRRIGITLVALFLLLAIWLVIAYFSFRGGVGTANKRLPGSVKAALTPDTGMLLLHSTDVLMLGTDHSTLSARASDRHSDSMMVLRTDPTHGRLVYLSIPRDLRVPNIPGHGPDKINAAMQLGGPALAARTVTEYTGLPINHLMVVDFTSFASLIDKVGGITLNVPERIQSNRFDCPLSTQEQCARWPGWRFAKGPQQMNGYRALIYSRIRENLLKPGESDITRSARQQQVIQALTSKLTSVSTLLKLPFIGGELMKPLTTDLSANEFLQLGWLKFRAKTTLHCRLGGSASGGYIDPSESNRNVILMVLGKSAPQPPSPSNETFPPGCYVNRLPPGGG